MLLRELFDDKPVNLVDDLRALMIDILTPLAANQVPFVTVQQIVDRLREVRSGARVDRNLVMTVLDPNEVKVVKKIEGDRIYLALPVSDEVSKTEDDEEREKERIRGKAQKQATKQASADDSVSKAAGEQARSDLMK